MRNSKKIIAQVNNNTKKIIKNTLNPGEFELAFCDLRQPQYRPNMNSVTNFKLGIPIIIVKKKNGFNQSSNYYAIKVDTNSPKILAEGLGKKEFYDNLIKKNQIILIQINYWQLKY